MTPKIYQAGPIRVDASLLQWPGGLEWVAITCHHHSSLSGSLFVGSMVGKFIGEEEPRIEVFQIWDPETESDFDSSPSDGIKIESLYLFGPFSLGSYYSANTGYRECKDTT